MVSDIYHDIIYEYTIIQSWAFNLILLYKYIYIYIIYISSFVILYFYLFIYAYTDMH